MTSAIAASAVRLPSRKTPLAAGDLTVTLQAVPNADFRPGSYERELSVPLSEVAAGNMAEAVKTVGAFIAAYDLGGGNLPAACGLVRQGGKPIARVSYNGRVWAVDGSGRETGEELVGELAP